MDQLNQSANSLGLKPIYKKVEELIRLKQAHAQAQIERKPTIVKVIEPVPKIQFRIPIDRHDQVVRKREKGNTHYESSPLKNSNFTNRVKKYSQEGDSLKVKTKSEKMINFLKAHQSENKFKRSQTPVFYERQQEDNRQTFTPMRPISRISRPPQSVTGTQFTKRSSQNRSSGGYSQVARLSQASNNKSSTPSKYLRKGHRMRETLLKQLQGPQDIEQENELVYLKQYDQWVPASLVSYKKLELQHFLNILMGGKKQQKKETFNFQPIYL